MGLHPAAQSGPAGACTGPQKAHGERSGGEGLARSGQPSRTWRRAEGGRGGGLWRPGGVGSGAKKQAGLGTPKDLSLKKFVSPPLTLTLFLGPSFPPFPFREGGSWSPASSTPRTQLQQPR